MMMMMSTMTTRESGCIAKRWQQGQRPNYDWTLSLCMQMFTLTCIHCLICITIVLYTMYYQMYTIQVTTWTRHSHCVQLHESA